MEMHSKLVIKKHGNTIKLIREKEGILSKKNKLSVKSRLSRNVETDELKNKVFFKEIFPSFRKNNTAY